MKAIIWSVGIVLAVGCSESPDANLNFAVNKRPPKSADLTEPEYFHAYYTFKQHLPSSAFPGVKVWWNSPEAVALRDYDDVSTAVRIRHVKHAPNQIEVIDLSDNSIATAKLVFKGDKDYADRYTGETEGKHGGRYNVFPTGSHGTKWLGQGGDNNKDGDGECCEDIRFHPDALKGVVLHGKDVHFHGKPDEDNPLTAEKWAELAGEDDTMGGGQGLSPSDLTSTEVGKMHIITAKHGTADVSVSLEAHSATGKVDKALAHWAMVGENAYDVSKMLSAGKGDIEMFMTAAAVGSIDKIVGLLSDGTKIGESSVQALASSETNKLSVDGIVNYAFSSGESAPDIMIVKANGTVTESASTSKIPFGNTYLIAIGSSFISCSSGQMVFAKTSAGRIHQAD